VPSPWALRKVVKAQQAALAAEGRVMAPLAPLWESIELQQVAWPLEEMEIAQ